jgi:hypothetical protein
MGKKNGKTKSKRDEAAVAAVIEWLDGSLQDITFLLNDAMVDEDRGRREAASFFLGVAIREAAGAAVRVLQAGGGIFDQFAALYNEVSADELLRIVRIPPLDPNAGNDRQQRLKDHLLALLEKKITTAANMSGDVQWIARVGGRQLAVRA